MYYIPIEFKQKLTSNGEKTIQRCLLSFTDYQKTKVSSVILKGVEIVKSKIIDPINEDLSVNELVIVRDDKWIFTTDALASMIDSIILKQTPTEKNTIELKIKEGKWHDFELTEGYFERNKVEDLESAALIFECLN